ncbi:MAG: hypothetical protein WCB04_05615 [Mycobacteriales bacterium]
MTESPDADAPHAAAESDTQSRAANQVRNEHIPPRGVDDELPSSGRNQPDSVAEGAAPGMHSDRPQAGVPDTTVTDTTPAPGTSEAMPPVQGTHTPDVGPGGDDLDTDDPASRGGAAGTR